MSWENLVIIHLGLTVVLPAIFTLQVFPFPKKRLRFWVFACLVNPILLFLSILAAFSLSNPGKIQETMYAMVIFTGGLAGLVGSMLWDSLEPTIKPIFLLIMFILVLGQWFAIWYLGNRWLRKQEPIPAWRVIALCSVFFLMAIFSLLNIAVQTAIHS